MDSLSYDIYKNEFKLLRDRLRNALQRNNEFDAKMVFMRMGYQVPYESFMWIAYNTVPSLSLLDLLFHRQLVCDDFVNNFINSSNDLSELTVYDVIKQLTNSDTNFGTKDVYFIQELLSDGDPTQFRKYPITNIKKNYKDIYFCLNEIILDTAYYAQSQILENIVHLIKKYGLRYQFQPLEIGKHKAVYQWLLGNLAKSRRAEALGWSSGPDSGKWPSTNIIDYESVCNLLYQLM